MVETATQAAGDGPDPHGDVDLPVRIGPFRILERIGAGGMGVVFLAERREPIEQRVALKVIRTDRLERTYRARFAMEQAALARMDHPNIARLLDAGLDEGQSWFAMEFVPGTPLSDYCREHRLSIGARLRLFAQVCDGVQHAHMKGILHRDLKPANVLVREIDGRPVAKIIDFGLAQPTDPLQIRATLHESMRQIVGTFAYMSPEQAERTEGDLDTRTDVYSLGVVLYELLTGVVPLDVDEAQRRGLAWIGDFLREHEPKKPSTRLSTMGERLTSAAAERGTSPHRLRASVHGDLDWVTMKALERDRQRRYPTVRELGRDIERYLRHQPVEAGPPGGWYRAKKWLRRHVRGVAVVGLVVATGASFVLRDAVLKHRQVVAEARRTTLARAALASQFLDRADTDLWPVVPATVPRIEAWLSAATELVGHRAELTEMRTDLAATSAAGSGSDRVDVAWQAAMLDKGLADFEELERRIPLVRARSVRAAALQARTTTVDAKLWADAIRDVASDARLAGFSLRPMCGLVPLGRNPVTGLQEFYLLDGGVTDALPVRGADGAYDVRPETGLILVLVPGGDIDVPCASDGAVVRGRLDPFFLSRYEMTQAQWVRMMGEGLSGPDVLSATYNIANEPDGLQRSAGGPGEQARSETTSDWTPVTWIHPLQQITWLEATLRLPRWQLALPTSAQWLRAASASTDATVHFDWISHDSGSQINFRDAACTAHGEGQGIPAGSPSPTWDGFVFTSPVGALAPNPFGFHDIFGNVAELCRDGYREAPCALVGPELATWDARVTKRAVHCGGSWANPWPLKRPWRGSQVAVGNTLEWMGVRPLFVPDRAR